MPIPTGAKHSTRFQPGNPGRPTGAKDKRPRAGSIRKVYEDLVETDGLHEDMKKAVKSGVRNPKRALGYLELGAKVLDRVDQQTGQTGPRVTIVFQAGVRPEKLRSPEVLARARLGPSALPAAGNSRSTPRNRRPDHE